MDLSSAIRAHMSRNNLNREQFLAVVRDHILPGHPDRETWLAKAPVSGQTVTRWLSAGKDRDRPSVSMIVPVLRTLDAGPDAYRDELVDRLGVGADSARWLASLVHVPGVPRETAIRVLCRLASGDARFLDLHPADATYWLEQVAGPRPLPRFDEATTDPPAAAPIPDRYKLPPDAMGMLGRLLDRAGLTYGDMAATLANAVGSDLTAEQIREVVDGRRLLLPGGLRAWCAACNATEAEEERAWAENGLDEPGIVAAMPPRPAVEVRRATQEEVVMHWGGKSVGVRSGPDGKIHTHNMTLPADSRWLVVEADRVPAKLGAYLAAARKRLAEASP